VLAGLAAFAGQAAVIYKWTDADGVVHYSDQSVPGAEKVYTGSSNTFAGAATRPPEPTVQKPAVPRLNYAQFSIASPAPEQSFFGDEVVAVQLQLEPDLKPDQIITWHLNGKELDQGPTTTHFALPRQDRGTYVIAATITDQSTGESASSNNVTFYVRQPSELAPQHQKP